MTLSPLVRNRLFAAGAALVAVWLGLDVAQGQLFWAVALAIAVGLLLLAKLQPLSLTTVLLGVLVAGYVVGSRGFAQLSLSSRLPLFPGELVLVPALALLLFQSAWRHTLPIRRDGLNLLLLAWLAYGTLKIGFDFRRYGFVALRDFAAVYYALFFYVAQEAGRDAAAQVFFRRVLTGSCAALLPAVVLFHQFPGFFLGTLTWNGNPLIFYKDDLAATFLGVGSVLFFLRYEAGRTVWNALASIALAGAVLAMNNRAALLALAVSAGWLALRGRWRFGAVLGGSGLVAVLVLLSAAALLRVSWEKTPVFGLYERVVSIADPFGQRSYRGAQTFNKGDNNLFRAVWWQAVWDETVHENPYTGVGFGADLAERFVREYYPESGEEFSTRSPHNFLLTVFARMGAVGLLLFLGVVGAVAKHTWHALRAGPGEAGLWCALWAILTSACLGVVLEGPMGAVIFWSTLGFAHAGATAGAENAPPPLPSPAASVSRDPAVP